MDLDQGPLLKVHTKINFFHHGGCRWSSDSHYVLQFLRVLSRSVFFALMLLSLLIIGGLWRRGCMVESDGDGLNYIDSMFLDSIFKDLFEKGLMKKGDSVLVLSSQPDLDLQSFGFLNGKEKEISPPNELFDVVMVFGSQNGKSADPFVKIGGLLVYQSEKFSSLMKKNYNFVYFNPYDPAIVAMRKKSIANNHERDEFSTIRKLFHVGKMSKKAALEGLENVLLEPPRKGIQKSRKMLQMFHYLPDLLHDNLETYERLVFVEVGSKEGKGAATKWFKESYPKRNKRFELYEKGDDASNWLISNGREEDFVVMKAEAEEVEKMIETKTLALVDELFLECDSQWQIKRSKKSRAYWECLSLYGRLRDEGIAVHQWWG